MIVRLGMALLAMALALGCDPPCGTREQGTGTCVLEECASSCTDRPSALACCEAAHTRGLSGEARDYLLHACSGDECEPEQYLSEAGAVCAAQVHGLSPGVAACTGWFVAGTGGFVWEVSNLTDGMCGEGEDDAAGAGGTVIVDATDGALVATGSFVADFCN